MKRRLKAYQRVRVTTAAPGELVVFLYEALLKSTSRAMRSMDAKLFADVGQAIGHALEIICHLRESVDAGPNPELARSLDTMYEAWGRVMVRAQLEQDTAAIADIHSQMTDMHAAWTTACAQASAQMAEGA